MRNNVMVDSLPKNGKLQKGQYLSLHFFEKEISKSTCLFSSRFAGSQDQD